MDTAVAEFQNLHPHALHSVRGLVRFLNFNDGVIFPLTLISFVTGAVPADLWSNACSKIAILACARPMLSELVV